MWGYTAQFGGGLSATLSAEERRDSQNIDFSDAAPRRRHDDAWHQRRHRRQHCAQASGYGGWQPPDIVGNLRVDQAWGTAQVMGALHEVNAGYYGNTVGVLGSGCTVNTTVSVVGCGGPGDEWGWVVGGWVHLNLPVFAHGDYIEAEVNYTEGALKYLYNGEDSNMDKVNGAFQGFGVADDCTYGGSVAFGTATSCHLTTGWSAVAGFEHYWTPQWHQSFSGGYIHVQYDKGLGSANAMLCGVAGFGDALGGTLALEAPGCDNDWSAWGVGTRLQWDVTKTFYLGVEVMYNQLQSASTPVGTIGGYALAAPAQPLFVADQSNWAFTLRAHRDFLP